MEKNGFGPGAGKGLGGRMSAFSPMRSWAMRSAEEIPSGSGQVSTMSMMAAMSATTAVDRRCVTVCQWRSMKTKATTDCNRMTGAMTMMSERG